MKLLAYVPRNAPPGTRLGLLTDNGIRDLTPRYLHDGDRLRCEIEGIGVLENSVVDELPRAGDHAAAAGLAELMELAR